MFSFLPNITRQTNNQGKKMKQCQETKQYIKPDSDMIPMFELLDREFKISMINILRGLKIIWSNGIKLIEMELIEAKMKNVISRLISMSHEAKEIVNLKTC